MVRESEVPATVGRPARAAGEDYVKTIDCLIETLQEGKEEYLKTDKNALLKQEASQHKK